LAEGEKPVTDTLNQSAAHPTPPNLPPSVLFYYPDLQEALKKKQTIVIHSTDNQGKVTTVFHTGSVHGAFELGSVNHPPSKEDGQTLRHYIREQRGTGRPFSLCNR